MNPETELLTAAALMIGRDRADMLLRQIKDAYPLEMRLCEQDCVILKPNQPYIFTVDPDCEKCLAIEQTCHPKPN